LYVSSVLLTSTLYLPTTPPRPPPFPYTTLFRSTSWKHARSRSLDSPRGRPGSTPWCARSRSGPLPVPLQPGPLRLRAHHGVDPRSEEHTSELQSLTNLVCRLLLEKK